jgi:hypothetical protein
MSKESTKALFQKAFSGDILLNLSDDEIAVLAVYPDSAQGFRVRNLTTRP